MDVVHRPLKLYFLPFLAAGHMIPLCEIARSFAAHGQHVTIITTPANARVLQNSIERDRAPAHHITIHTVDFPAKEACLPDGVENLESCTDSESTVRVSNAARYLLQKSFEDFILQNPPDCLVSDFMYPWTDQLATRLGIPRLVFSTFFIFCICALESIQKNPITGEDPNPFIIPGLPRPITMNIRPLKLFLKAIAAPLEGQVKSYGLLVNSFAEFDGEFVQHYMKTTGHRAWHIGPTSLIYRIINEKAKSEKNDAEPCMSWLDSKKPNSVLYVCFGSSSHLSDTQLNEIASGIESSGHNFIWVICGKDHTESEEEREKWLPKGFERRMRKEDKGMILWGWAPQALILGHEAIGGFLTHCGTNSVVESAAAGVPMATWPFHGDQFFSEKLVTQVHGVGVEVGTEECCVWVFEERKKIVNKEKIEKAVRRLMDRGEEGNEMRRRARELGKKAREALGEGGSSQENLKSLIRELQSERDSN